MAELHTSVSDYEAALKEGNITRAINAYQDIRRNAATRQHRGTQMVSVGDGEELYLLSEIAIPEIASEYNQRSEDIFGFRVIRRGIDDMEYPGDFAVDELYERVRRYIPAAPERLEEAGWEVIDGAITAAQHERSILREHLDNHHLYFNTPSTTIYHQRGELYELSESPEFAGWEPMIGEVDAVEQAVGLEEMVQYFQFITDHENRKQVERSVTSEQVAELISEMFREERTVEGELLSDGETEYWYDWDSFVPREEAEPPDTVSE
ncbi:MAG: hypothetical protein SVY41_03485 [Candidatus Nanohaloarchaea archaeon]|nr:hypothetical protein [Candidatus Nanohaloarchaea archaeon]